jgi:tight adherence protein B
MGDHLIFGIPALAFLVVSGLAVMVVLVWTNKLSPRARALSNRLSDLTPKNFAGVSASLSNRGILDSDFWGWFIKKLPSYDRLLQLIVRSGESKSPLQIVLLCLSLYLVGLIVLMFIQFSFFIAVFVALVFGFIPIGQLLLKEQKRGMKFEEQLPEALDFISRALQAGHGLSSAIIMVGEELPDPVGTEFRITSEQINFGLSFNDALSNLASRVKSGDLNFLVTSLVIQRDTGGNLSELLNVISKTIRERLKLKGKIRVLSAEGRLSGMILTLLPFILGLVLYLIHPEYISQLWTTPSGLKMLLVTGVLTPIGVLWMWKIVQIKV